MILVSDQKVDKVKEAVMLIHLSKAIKRKKAGPEWCLLFSKALSPRGVHEE